MLLRASRAALRETLITLMDIARFDNNDNVKGWYSRDRHLKEIDVTDRSIIDELNLRYKIRQSKGEFHHWQRSEEDRSRWLSSYLKRTSHC
jgi:hypothetical protein